MKVSTDLWHYKLYEFGSPSFQGRGVGGCESLCTYVRRATLGVAFKACGVVVGGIILVLFYAVCGVLTLLANLVTIPLGFGLVTTFPKEKFLKIPFVISLRGKEFCPAKILIPFWALIFVVTGLWFFGLSNHLDETVAALSMAGRIIACIVAFITAFALADWISEEIPKRARKGKVEMSNSSAWQLVKMYYKAKKERFCPTIEFVEPSSIT